MVGVKPLRDSPLSGKEGDVPTCVSGCQDSARDKEQGMYVQRGEGHHVSLYWWNQVMHLPRQQA